MRHHRSSTQTTGETTMDRDQINDYALTKEAEALAAEIFANMLEGMASDETPEDYRDELSDQAHMDADGHQWVIYTYKAHQLCANCNTDNGEAFLEDAGNPDPVTYDSLATAIAYGELLARIELALNELVEAWEDTRDEGAE
jgi:hypothetical protein